MSKMFNKRSSVSPANDESINDVPRSKSPSPAASPAGSTKVLTTTSQYTLHPTSSFMAVVAIIKAYVGTGILSLPMALYYAGIWLGTTIIVVTFFIMADCMHILVNCADGLCDKYDCVALSFGDVTYLTFRYGPDKLRKFGRPMKVAIDAVIATNQCGLIIVYIIFIAHGIDQIVVYHLPNTSWVDVRLYQLAVAVTLVPLALIRTLRTLTYMSVGANIVMFTAYIVIFQYCIRFIQPLSHVPAYKLSSSDLLTLGMSVFTFSGIANLLPIRNKMAQPRAMGGTLGQLNRGLAVVLVFNLAMALLGYLCFADNIQESITLSIPTDDWTYVVLVKMFLMVSVYVSAGFQLYFAVGIMWGAVRVHITSPCLQSAGIYIMRIFILALCYGLSAAIPFFHLMVSLIGAIFGINTAIVFPPLLELIQLWPDKNFGRCHWKLIKDIVYIIVGLIGCAAGTYLTVLEIIQASIASDARSKTIAMFNYTPSFNASDFTTKLVAINTSMLADAVVGLASAFEDTSSVTNFADTSSLANVT